MSFGVSLDQGSFEYAGSARGLFAQKRNLMRPRMWSMTKDILRFFKEGPAFLEAPDENLSLHDYLRREGYSVPFIYDHLLPMAGAIWSCSLGDVLKFPAVSFLQFYRNHGLLQVEGRPQWRTVAGGSRSYIKALLADYRGEVRLSSPVTGLRRTPVGAFIETANIGSEFLGDEAIARIHRIAAQTWRGPTGASCGASSYDAASFIACSWCPASNSSRMMSA